MQNNDFARRRVRGFTLVVAGGLAVSGVALAAGALGASAVFKRGSLAASLFVGSTVLLTAVTLGWAVSPIVLRLLAGAQTSALTGDRSQDSPVLYQSAAQSGASSNGRH